MDINQTIELIVEAEHKMRFDPIELIKQLLNITDKRCAGWGN